MECIRRPLLSGRGQSATRWPAAPRVEFPSWGRLGWPPKAGFVRTRPPPPPFLRTAPADGCSMAERRDAERLIDGFLALLAQGVIQFAPEEPHELSPLDQARISIRILAEVFAEAGEVTTRDVLLKAIEVKREKGRPTKWQVADILDLWSDAMHLARSNPQLRARTIFTQLAGSSEWEGQTSEALR